VLEQELRSKIVVEGQHKAVEALATVDQATKKLSDADAKQTAAIEKKTKATDEAALSLDKYSQAIESVLPGMGQFLTRGSAMVQVLGGLGKAQLSTSSVIAAGTAALGKYAGALALGGAASVFLVGAKAMSDALQRIKRDAEAAKKSIEDLRKAQTEEDERIAEQVEGIVAQRDASGRPVSFDEQTAMTAALAAAPESIRGGLSGVIGSFGAPKEFGGAGAFSGAQLEALARLGFKTDDAAPQEQQTAQAQAFLESNQGNVQIINERQRRAASAVRTGAADELTTTDPTVGQANIERLVGRQSEELGVDPKVLKALVEKEVARRVALMEKAAKSGGKTREALMAQATAAPDAGSVDVGGGASGMSATRSATPTEIVGLDAILKAVLPEIAAQVVNTPDIGTIRPGGRPGADQSRDQENAAKEQNAAAQQTAAAAQQLHAAAAALQNAVEALAASGGRAPTVVQYGGRYNSTPAKGKTGAGHAATVEGVFEY
jgi:hypothetical protein